MAINITKFPNVILQGATSQQIIFSTDFVSANNTDKYAIKGILTQNGIAVNISDVFKNPIISTVNPITNANDTATISGNEIAFGEYTFDTDGTNATAVSTITFDIADDLAENDYNLQIVVTQEDTSSAIATLDDTTKTFKVISAESALVDYETLIQNISSEDLDAIEKDKQQLIEAQQLAYTAVNALEDGDNKTALLTRYNTAYDNQCSAFKLLYLYYAKNNYLTLFKVNNVGGNMPYSIIFKDDKLIGSATEAFYYAPNSNKPISLTISDPKTTNILFGGADTVSGEYIYIFKIADVYYRVIINDTVENNIVTINTINDIEITDISTAGDSYTVPSEVVDKTALNSLLSESNADYNAHDAGTEAGQVPETQRTAFKEVIDSAQAVADNADAQADEVAKALNDLTTAKSTFDGFIVKYYVDETTLQTNVDNANALIKSVTVGDGVGQTTQANIDTYQTAIDNAQKVLDNTPSYVDFSNTDVYNGYVTTVNDAITALSDATDTFNKSIITSAQYAESKLKAYETYAQAFLDNIRKKITI